MSEIPGIYKVNGVIQFPRNRRPMTTGGDPAPYEFTPKRDTEHKPSDDVVVQFKRRAPR